MTTSNTTIRLVCATSVLSALSILYPSCLHALTIEKVTLAESAHAGPAALPLHNAPLPRRSARTMIPMMGAARGIWLGPLAMLPALQSMWRRETTGREWPL